MIVHKHVHKVARHALLESADVLRQLEKFSQKERLAMARRLERMATRNQNKYIHVPCAVDILSGFDCPVATSENIAEVLDVPESKVVKEINTLLDTDDGDNDQFLGVTFEQGSYKDDDGNDQLMYFLDHGAVDLLLTTRFWHNPNTRLALLGYGIAFRNPPVERGVDVAILPKEK